MIAGWSDIWDPSVVSDDILHSSIAIYDHIFGYSNVLNLLNPNPNLTPQEQEELSNFSNDNVYKWMKIYIDKYYSFAGIDREELKIKK
jgi:hypothetical protein